MDMAEEAGMAGDDNMEEDHSGHNMDH